MRMMAMKDAIGAHLDSHFVRWSNVDCRILTCTSFKASLMNAVRRSPQLPGEKRDARLQHARGRASLVSDGLRVGSAAARSRQRAEALRLWRPFILLRQDGEPSGINRIYRLYREEGLTVRTRRARWRAAGTRAPILVEAIANAGWSLDFVHDKLTSGRRFRILNIVDDVTRETDNGKAHDHHGEECRFNWFCCWR